MDCSVAVNPSVAGQTVSRVHFPQNLSPEMLGTDNTRYARIYSEKQWVQSSRTNFARTTHVPDMYVSLMFKWETESKTFVF